MTGSFRHTSFLRALDEAPLVLTEGSVVERLRRHPAGLLDPHVANASLLFTPEGREALAGQLAASPSLRAREMARVHAELGTRLLGGCCGTDERHIAALAGALRHLHPSDRA